MQIFHSIDLPFCKVLTIGEWNAPAHRYFIAYISRGEFRHVLGLPVIDEYATFSSPIFFGPIPILGKIYNAGISLAHLRDPDMGMETGWPPLCIGLNAPAPELPPNWEQSLIKTLQSPPSDGDPSTLDSIDGFTLQRTDIGNATIFATDAPLLPKQLRRICQLVDSPFVVAFSTGNGIVSKDELPPVSVHTSSEAALTRLLTGFQGLKKT